MVTHTDFNRRRLNSKLKKKKLFYKNREFSLKMSQATFTLALKIRLKSKTKKKEVRKKERKKNNSNRQSRVILQKLHTGSCLGGLFAPFWRPGNV